MSFRKLAAVLAGRGSGPDRLRPAVQPRLVGPQRPTRRQRRHLPGGLDDGQARRGGHHPRRHEVRPAALRAQGPRRQAGRLRRRDRQDRLRQARHPGRQDRLHRDALEDPRGRHRQRPGRHGGRHLHDQRRPQAEGLLRRAVLHRGPGPDGQVRQHDDHRAGDAEGRQRPGVLGERLDARPRTSRSTSTRPTSCCSTSTPSAPTRCATARSRPSPPTTSSSPAWSSTSQGAFKLVNKPFTKEPYGIGITKGDTAFCQFINDTLKASDADGSYSAAWKATVGTVQPEVPPLPAADACS